MVKARDALKALRAKGAIPLAQPAEDARKGGRGGKGVAAPEDSVLPHGAVRKQRFFFLFQNMILYDLYDLIALYRFT